jgi:hypothetical protein
VQADGRRLLTGSVTKNSQSDREGCLAVLAMPAGFRQLAAASEDAFDAAVYALLMAASVDRAPPQRNHDGGRTRHRRGRSVR